MGVPWGQSVRFGRRKNFWRWTVVMFTQPREHMYLKMVQVVTVCYAYLTTILTKRASLESLGREFPASLPVTRKRNQLLRRRNKRLGPRRPQQGGRDLVRPVSEARPRESPRPQDPVRLTPHEAQDKHTKHPAPRGPRRGGAPQAATPLHVRALGRSLPGCILPAVLRAAGRGRRRRAEGPSGPEEGRAPGARPQGQKAAAGKAQAQRVPAAPELRPTGISRSACPRCCQCQRWTEPPASVGNTLRSPLRPESTCCFPEGSGAKARGRRDPPQPHLHAAVQLLPRQAAPRRLLQRLRRQPHRALQALQHLPLVGIRGLA